MDINERINLIKEVGEEILTEDDLKILLETKDTPMAYDGFEPSGIIHIAQGVLRAINVNKMIKAGCKFKMWVADWHAWANNKLGGDLEKIQTVGDYMIEVWKASGMDLDNVEFVWAKDAMSNDEYWKMVMGFARNSTVKRILRCSQIMGREESQSLQASQIFYPCMQAADIFYLDVDICQLGMDQRKVNVLARELGPKLGFWKPVAVHHSMLMGLTQPPKTAKTASEKALEMKMSKSKPDSAIFMTDSKDDVQKKISKAYCPEKQVEENPIIDYCRHIIFNTWDTIEIDRPRKFGGPITIEGFDDLIKVYSAGDLHPMDLKQSVAKHINGLLIPVRKHFEKNSKAKKLLEEVQGFEITR